MNGFKFTSILGLGVSLSWLGFVPSNFSLTPSESSGIYSIDGQNAISSFVPALGAANSRTVINYFLKRKRLNEDSNPEPFPLLPNSP